MLRKNFIHEFSCPVLQWRRQNFGLGGGAEIQQKCTKIRLFFEKFITKFAQNFKNLLNCSNIKFNRI